MSITSPNRDTLEWAKELLLNDELVAIPTETVYGLAGNALSTTAINRIFQTKGRPSTNPLIVHIAATDLIYTVANIADERTERRLHLISRAWPGPLTVILPKQASIPDQLSAGLSTVAVRIPNHPVALELLKRVRVPLAAPSANKSNQISPTSAQDVLEEFGDQLKLILDGGPCAVGLESTIVDLTLPRVAILRPGILTPQEIEEYLGEHVEVATHSRPQGAEAVIPAVAPGLSRLHYSPKTPLIFADTFQTLLTKPERLGWISFSADLPKNVSPAERRTLSASGDLRECAQRLFATLRELDRCNLELIVVERCTTEAIGLALMDRLSRATGSR